MKPNKTATAACLAVLSLGSSTVMADKGAPLIDRDQLSIGGGLSLNSVASDDEIGYQVFAAYHLDDFNLMQYVDTSVELGYMNYGDFAAGNSGGLWVNGVIDGAIRDNIGWVARLGFDFGDDSGLMVGGGAAVYIDKRNTMRVEYVVRDDVDSLQLNFVHRM